MNNIQSEINRLCTENSKLNNIIDNVELICRQALDDENVRPIAEEILKVIER